MRMSIIESGWFGLLRPVLLATLLVIPGTCPEHAQAVPAAQTPAQQAVSAPAQQEESAETLHLLAGRSLVITSPARIRRVSVADPTIIDAVVVNPNQLLINGKAPGASSLVMWDEAGQSQTFDVLVDLDVVGLGESIHDVLPSEQVQVQATRGVVTLSGQVSSQAVADRIIQMAQASVPKKEQVVSLLQVPMAPTTGEVLLEVKFADVDRVALNELGINILSLPGAKNVFTTSTQQFSPPQLQSSTITSVGTTTTTGPAIGNSFTLSDLLNVFIFRPDINLAATIRALESRNVLELLAEPNVLTETGKEASFLAGGQFPYPVVQASAGSVPVVTIQFREFGVKLNFTPVITPDGLIHLKVEPSVSSLDYSNAITLQGYTIPALSTRQVLSEMILKDGQSFAIAGLVNNQVTEELSKVPGLGSMPILGKLFQSRSVNKSRDELLVMVTPRIVHVGSPPPQPSPLQFPTPFLAPLPRENAPSPGQK
jgi:pilus assembly protein CpaC